MKDKKPAVDVLNEVLEDSLLAYPLSSLLISLYQQYNRRGFLTKKQILALHKKASGIPGFSVARLATLEAIARKMPNRFKSELPVEVEKPKDTSAKDLLVKILSQYPQHKRVLYLQTRLESEGALHPKEVEELKKFEKLLLQSKK